MLDNAPNQPSKYKTKYWVDINDESRGMYNEENQIRIKTSMLRQSLCDYSGAYLLVKGAEATFVEIATETKKKML